MLISSPFYYQLLHAQIPKVQKYGEKKHKQKKLLKMLVKMTVC